MNDWPELIEQVAEALAGKASSGKGRNERGSRSPPACSGRVPDPSFSRNRLSAADVLTSGEGGP
jgi:hypothetical protein